MKNIYYLKGREKENERNWEGGRERKERGKSYCLFLVPSPSASRGQAGPGQGQGAGME